MTRIPSRDQAIPGTSLCIMPPLRINLFCNLKVFVLRDIYGDKNKKIYDKPVTVFSDRTSFNGRAPYLMITHDFYPAYLMSQICMLPFGAPPLELHMTFSLSSDT